MMVLGLLGTTSSVKQKMGICLWGHTSLLEQEPQAPRETDGATSAKHSAGRDGGGKRKRRKKKKRCLAFPRSLDVTNWNSSRAEMLFSTLLNSGFSTIWLEAGSVQQEGKLITVNNGAGIHFQPLASCPLLKPHSVLKYKRFQISLGEVRS